MKILFIEFIVFAFLASNIKYSFGQDVIKPYDSKEQLESDVRIIINDFDRFMKDMGTSPPYVPSVEIQTAPFLIKWDEPNKGLILPYWDELSKEQMELFKIWRGENAEEFFISLFNWFFIPHELGHFMVLNNPNINLTPFESERAANEFAVKFLTSKNENQKKIQYVKESLQEILKILPTIDFGNMTEEEYFNANYNQLGNNPNAYGYFQFKFILDIFNDQGKINLLDYLDQ